MDKLEMVIKGLECCTDVEERHHFDCPYYDQMGAECLNNLLCDALVLLKAQQPRLMTLKEARDAEVVWVEDRATNEVYICLVKNNMNDSGLYKYGTQWRVWNARPTDEQRETTPWE